MNTHHIIIARSLQEVYLYVSQTQTPQPEHHALTPREPGWLGGSSAATQGQLGTNQFDWRRNPL